MSINKDKLQTVKCIAQVSNEEIIKSEKDVRNENIITSEEHKIIAKTRKHKFKMDAHSRLEKSNKRGRKLWCVCNHCTSFVIKVERKHQG